MFGRTLRGKLLLVGGAYAAWKYFNDPQQGAARRAQLQEQIEALKNGAAKQGRGGAS